ncbi:MAG: acyl-ACP--UDP-N-acetylglucosamine O-acyltransferase [Immundisolibacter sp.]|uniref:acyl-ACP--UDP-N-acetylglucosamine O-acyltransferase n=1 Tax=Immundisolibacter sp. TaxID=1934948 RepID=UPI003D1517F0
MIDPTARVHPDAQLAPDVEVGAYSVIGPQVRIGAGSVIGPHTVITGNTTIGRNNRVFQFASLGEVPQDKKYHAGEDTRLDIGDGNTIREFCTLNVGTVGGGGVTRLGDDNWLMAYVHIAHDCLIGSHTIFANSSSLAGHVTVEDHVILGGFALVHQFCALGAHSFLGASSLVLKDVPPFVMAEGNSARPRGINSEGLRRRGFSTDDITTIRNAYKALYRSGLRLQEALAVLDGESDNPHVALMAAFVRRSQRGIIR